MVRIDFPDFFKCLPTTSPGFKFRLPKTFGSVNNQCTETKWGEERPAPLEMRRGIMQNNNLDFWQSLGGLMWPLNSWIASFPWAVWMYWFSATIQLYREETIIWAFFLQHICDHSPNFPRHFHDFYLFRRVFRVLFGHLIVGKHIVTPVLVFGNAPFLIATINGRWREHSRQLASVTDNLSIAVFKCGAGTWSSPDTLIHENCCIPSTCFFENC